MAGTAFVTFLLLGDAAAAQRRLSKGTSEEAPHLAERVLLLRAVAILPVCLSIYTGITRITDYWHHPWDVVTGWAIGGLVARLGASMYEAGRE